MPSALGYGLMGAAQGALQGLGQAWQTTQNEIKTQRLMAAEQLKAQQLAQIQAQYKNAELERKHENALELEGVKAKGRGALEADRQAAADRRAELDATSRERAASIRANRPSGKSSSPKPGVARLPDNSGWGYADLETGEFRTDAEGNYLVAPTPTGERNKPAVAKPAPSATAEPSGPEPIFVPPPTKGSPPIGPSQYAEGTRLRGPGGKLYIVRNGVPVAL